MVNAVNMPVSRERMEKYQKMHMRQIEHAAKQWDARESKVKNNALRKEWMEKQNAVNYRNEYDRIRGELSRYKFPFQSRTKLEQRKTDLQKLFSSGNV
jgi:hypothetical protein